VKEILLPFILSEIVPNRLILIKMNPNDQILVNVNCLYIFYFSVFISSIMLLAPPSGWGNIIILNYLRDNIGNILMILLSHQWDSGDVLPSTGSWDRNQVCLRVWNVPATDKKLLSGYRITPSEQRFWPYIGGITFGGPLSLMWPLALGCRCDHCRMSPVWPLPKQSEAIISSLIYSFVVLL